MLEYNGSSYVKPYGGPSNYHEQNQKKLLHSTASISSNNSESNLSTSKYSFKTGTLKNIYTLKHPLQMPQINSKPKLHHFINSSTPDPSFIPPAHTTSASTMSVHKFHQTFQPHLSRSKSQNTSFSKFKPLTDPHINSFTQFKPLSDPPINSYTQFKPQLTPTKIQNSDLKTFQRKRELQKENFVLKKSISQKRLNFQQHFGSLNVKIGFLKNQYKNQEQKMAKITAIISDYFA